MPRSDQPDEIAALLRASLAAGNDDRAARVQAGLLRLLIDEGAVAEVAGHLAPAPGGTPEFEVVVDKTDGGNGSAGIEPTRTVKQLGPDVARAFTEAVRASKLGYSAEVVAIEHGLRRHVLRNSSVKPGTLEFVHPDERSIEGEPSPRAAAVAGWLELVDGVEPPLLEPAAAAPSPDGVRDAIHEALGEIEIELDFDAVQDAVKAGLRDMGSGAAQKSDLSELRSELAELEKRLQSLTDIVSLSSSHALGAASRDDLAAATERLAGLIAAQPAAVEPAGAALDEVSFERLAALADRIHLQLEAFTDRVGASSRSLQALAEELASRDRSAAELTGQLADSTSAQLDRLASRLENRLDSLERAATVPGLAGDIRELSGRLGRAAPTKPTGKRVPAS